MNLNVLKPRQALNKAFLKVKPNRSEIDAFKTHLLTLLDRINDAESEEFHKNLVSDFLKDSYYKQAHFINTKGHNDLVIHNGTDAQSTVGVIIEAKKPTNRAEMISTTKLNAKAFQELVLYYLRERITHKNLEVKHLIVTNINEWFLFDATLFERLFAQNKTLVKQFTDFEEGRLADSKTDFFYKQIAEPFIAGITGEISFTYFNLPDFDKPLRNASKADDTALIALFKLLAPQHLLKLPFANDSNSLDKRFYSELLHIIGLTETKDGNKKLIQRNKPGERHTGSLLEDAIIQLDSLDKLSRLDKPTQFGATTEERLFNVALELSITWINRILFLKLLEAQLLTYHKGDRSYAFLSYDKIGSYDDLNSLFFQVLARRYEKRHADVRQAFEQVPYLNSSLFEPTDIEQLTLFISNLKDDKTLPLHPQTVLRDEQGRRRTGARNTLHYLFEFLNAYDFASEGSEDIQEDNKTLINASVLGLIFEKINGYKDGSFFTPGFITMYMCRETIRRAVVQKFNAVKGWSCNSIDELYDKIEDRAEANRIVNSLRICDPAVGSGHFLVSALNELIAVKHDLKILCDRQGKRLKEYQVEVVNDELIVTDEDGHLFEYNPQSKETQRVQEALFHEKQTLIENCLFGVDINPNSVKICRLRLWIELLKSAYYTHPPAPSQREGVTSLPSGGVGGGLETLPNIDINIKCGNSLVSRFALDADLKQALKKSKFSIDAYRLAVHTYRNAQNKEEKREMERLIATIKSDFRSEITKNDPKARRLYQLNGELFNLQNQQSLFELGKKEKAAWNKKVDVLTKEIAKLEDEIETIKANKIYENAFEWRFEFPEVLNEEGDYVGFDVVIGNPPYIRQEELAPFKSYFGQRFQTFAGTADLYVYFVELGMNLLCRKGQFSYILPNKWMRAGYGKNLRQYVKGYALKRIVDFGDLPVFEEATTYPCILELEQTDAVDSFETVAVGTLDFEEGLPAYINHKAFRVNTGSLQDAGWVLADGARQALLDKIKAKGKPLGEYVNGKIYRGVLTGYNEAFVIDAATRERLIAEDPRSEEIIKPFLAGRDLKRYQTPVTNKYLLFTRRGIDIELYPAIKKHLEQFRERLEPRPKNWPAGKEWKGRKEGTYKWYEVQDSIDYFKEFEQPKIMYQVFQVEPCFISDNSSQFCNNSIWFVPSYDRVLLGILNSRMGWFLISSYCTAIQNGFQLIWKYFAQIPIPDANTEARGKFLNIIDSIFSSKEFDRSADTTALEAEIDRLVYALYGLTEEEIALVEGQK